MDNFDEIKNLWQTHKTEILPSVTSINDVIKNYHSTKKKKIIFLVFLSVICMIAMIWVMVDYKSNFWTTRIGESLFIFLWFYLFFSKLKVLKRNMQEELLNSTDYLDNLKKKSKKKAASETQTILFIISSIALCFYVYEMLSESKTQLIVGYCMLFLFTVFMWFVYRPMKIKKQQNKIQNLLNKIDNIMNQTNGNQTNEKD